MGSRPLLVIAHPGHELLVHGWMTRTRPTVLVLADGSGGQGEARTEATRRTVVEAGATPGAIFGLAPDRRFHEAILARDARFFEAKLNATVAEFARRGVTLSFEQGPEPA